MLGQLKVFSNKAVDTASDAGNTAYDATRNGLNAVYRVAMNNPKTTVAVVLGTGVAAGLIWLVQRNGGFNSVRKRVLARVRRAPQRSTRSRRSISRAAAA